MKQLILRRALSALLCLVLALSLTACGGETERPETEGGSGMTGALSGGKGNVLYTIVGACIIGVINNYLWSYVLIVMLIGIVVNNAILIMDELTIQRAAGLDGPEAMRAAVERRPQVTGSGREADRARQLAVRGDSGGRSFEAGLDAEPVRRHGHAAHCISAGGPEARRGDDEPDRHPFRPDAASVVDSDPAGRKPPAGLDDVGPRNGNLP